MSDDRFWVKNQRKSGHQRDIIAIIRRKPATFGELAERRIVSRPVLANYLKQWEKEAIITRRFGEGGRREYMLTDKGKSEEEKRKEAMPAALELVKLLPQEPSVTKTLSELSKWAKQDPSAFELFMNEFNRIMANDDAIRWIAHHPGRKGAEEVKRELIKHIRAPQNLGNLTSEEQIHVAFDAISKAIRDISKESKRRQIL